MWKCRWSSLCSLQPTELEGAEGERGVLLPLGPLAASASLRLASSGVKSLAKADGFEVSLVGWSGNSNTCVKGSGHACRRQGAGMQARRAQVQGGQGGHHARRSKGRKIGWHSATP